MTAIADKLDRALTERIIEPTPEAECWETSRRKLDFNLACLRTILRQPVSPHYLDGIALAISMLENVREPMPEEEQIFVRELERRNA
jgi:hypothetical protein